MHSCGSCVRAPDFPLPSRTATAALQAGIWFHAAMEFPAPPDDAALEKLLDAYAPFAPAPLCPEIFVYQARDLYELWGAAEKVVGGVVSPPFWAVPWPAGLAIARVLLDSPVWARSRRCLDVGTGGGVVAIAAAKAGAATSVGADVDPWALAVARLAAAKNGVALRLVQEDLAEEDPDEPPDLILAADLEYEKTRAPLIAFRLEAAARPHRRAWRRSRRPATTGTVAGSV